MSHAPRLLLCGTTLAVLAAPAGAQTGQGSPGRLEEITVTAERREASLQDVPVAVSALPETVLQNRQISEAEDLQRVVPSLKMANNITQPTNLSPSLRGSLQQDASLIVAESPFGIYVDDVYVARLNGNNITLADIERVEVLRGPQGTLYGRNTLAGAIKFISRTPGETPWADVKVGAGNYDQYIVSGSVGGPIADAWAGSLAAQINNKDNQFENVVTGQETGKEENWAVRGKLRYMGSETFDAVLSYSYADSQNDALQLVPRSTPGVRSDCRVPPVDPNEVCQYTTDDLVAPPGFPTYAVGTSPVAPFPPPITAQPSGETKQTIASLNMSWDLGAVTLRSITGYVKVEDRFSTDFSGAFGNGGFIMGASEIDNDHWSQELQLQGSALGDRLNYIVGAYYFKEEGDQDFAWLVFAPFSTSQLQAETESVALFGQADYQLTSALKATAGVRWVEDDKSFDVDYQTLIGVPPSSVSLENTYSEVTPRFGLDYTIDGGGVIDTMLLYVSAAKGFKSGGYNGIVIGPADVANARSPYGPETNWTYEVGMKADFLDSRLRANLAYFYADISDLTLNATVDDPAGGPPSFPVQNAGDATIQGLEFEITAIPIDGLSIFLNGALQDGEYDSLNPTSAPALAPAVYGVEPVPPQVPDYAFTLGFDYGVDLAFLGGSRFKLGADYFKTDDFVTAADNSFLAKGYDRTSAYTGLEIGNHWELRFDVRNLTDEETIASGSRSLGGFILLPPREYMFSVRYRL
ncbi:MAG TPA: TonB-dependent receptor [Steroidobacteraceae bacterium]|nr:TonB-dependent receptor [Steroidobacteraceae bacterium]